MARFTIREVLLATALVAVLLGWWLDRSRGQTANEAAQPTVRHLQLIVTGTDNDKFFLYDAKTGAVWQRYSDGKWSPHAEALERP